MVRLARSLNTLRAQVDAYAPNRSKRSDGWIGDAAHQARTSDHNPDGEGIVRAIDITHDPGNGLDAQALADSLRLSRDTRIKYVIHNRRMFSSYATESRARWQWGPYSGTSNPHTGHVHVSIMPGNAADVDIRPWALPDHPTLRSGDRGSSVAELQRLLGVDPSGVFSETTLLAVRQFQQARGLTVDGIVGPVTWDALTLLTGPILKPAIPDEEEMLITFRDVKFRRRAGDNMVATDINQFGAGAVAVSVAIRSSFGGPHPAGVSWVTTWENDDPVRGRLVLVVPGGQEFNADVHIIRP